MISTSETRLLPSCLHLRRIDCSPKTFRPLHQIVQEITVCDSRVVVEFDITKEEYDALYPLSEREGEDDAERADRLQGGEEVH